MYNKIVLALKSYGLAITATGIENLSQLNQVRDLVGDCGQGYLLSKPLTATEAAKIAGAKSQVSFNPSSLS
jgi:EAL domain-containing protein (putative c-di-GMP-specific phosphodiesterase class I)